MAPIQIGTGVEFRQENLNLGAFNERAAHRLDKTLQQPALPSGDEADRRMLAGTRAQTNTHRLPLHRTSTPCPAKPPTQPDKKKDSRRIDVSPLLAGCG